MPSKLRKTNGAATPAGTIAVEKASPSMVKILEGALRIVGTRGAKRLTMRDICEAGQVSRATLYRHFSTKDEVLDAVTEYICVNFEIGVQAAADNHEDPIDRLRAVMAFFSRYVGERSPEPMLEIEPGFYLDFFRSHFTRHKVAVCSALHRTFDHFEASLGHPLDREGIAETMIRTQLSTLMVPADDHWLRLWDHSADIFTRALGLAEGTGKLHRGV